MAFKAILCHYPPRDMADIPQTGMHGRKWIWPAAATVLIAALWLFPRFWYTQSGAATDSFWLTERTNVTSWIYKEIPVGESAERALVADRLINGEYTNSLRQAVRVFSAKRYKENLNEIGLFVHTPDRCWTTSGWKVEPEARPDILDLDIKGQQLQFERRIFTLGGHRELVYFTGLTAGKPLPFRLDHNLNVAVKKQLRTKTERSGLAIRAVDQKFWGRVWESFSTRQQLLGPKQFLRISTPVGNESVSAADERLQAFLTEWLDRTDYETELKDWRSVAATSTEEQSRG